MKICPSCGYKDSPTARQCFRLIQLEFGDLPVLEMMKRRWIAGDLRTPIPIIKEELRRFFGLKKVEDLSGFLGSPTLPYGGIICNDIEVRWAAHLAAHKSDVSASALAAKTASEVLPSADAITQRGKRPAKEDRRSRAAFSNPAGLKVV